MKILQVWILVIAIIFSTGSFAPPAEAAQFGTFQQGLSYYKARRWYDAAKIFYSLSRLNNSRQAHQSKYYLSMSLYQLGLKQISAFPLIELIRNAKPGVKKVALNRLVRIANELGDTALLRLSLEKATAGNITEVAPALVYMGYVNIAEAKGDVKGALDSAEKGLFQAPNDNELLYARGSLYLQTNQTDKALADFMKVYGDVGNRHVLDRDRGMAILAIARTYYQERKWLEAIQWYREIPKDHEFFRAAQKELAWAFFRSGRFRSALGPLQSLTTPYYENFYDPETLVLKSIIYLFICKYEEMSGAISTFEKTYGPAYGAISSWLDQDPLPQDAWNEVENLFRNFSTRRGGKIMYEKRRKSPKIKVGAVPAFMIRSLLAEADINREIKYLNRLAREKQRLRRYSRDRNAVGLVTYGNKILSLRMNSVQNRIGQYVIDQLRSKLLEVADLQGQVDFLKYELLNDKKEFIRNKMTEAPESSFESGNSRDFYVQNGFYYYPFQGEYWRDEIGSYQYIGVNSCQR